MGWLTIKHSGNVFEDLKNTMIGKRLLNSST